MSDIKAFLADNPKMMGVLFTMMLFLAQAGSAAATGAVCTGGP